MKLVTAEWVPGFPVHYARENRTLHQGDTAKVPEDEARASDNWKIPTGKTQKASEPDPDPADAGEKE